MTNANNQIVKHQLPKRIILVRHGESEGNEDDTVFEYIPNHKIKLSKKGRHQAQMIGSKIRGIVSSEECENWKALFYVSPLSRTRETLEEIEKAFEKERVVGVRQECRLREQHFGNFQEVEERREIKKSRVRYGTFFYRVPNGESSADVHDRVSAFIEGGLRREMESNKFSDEMNLIIVSHGLTILLFLMKWFNWSVDEFEALRNPGNCEYRVLQLGPAGEYSLALHHQVDELKKWGLSDEMIDDQIYRARGRWVESGCSDGSTSFDDIVED